MSARTPYDEVRYSNFPYAQTHPDRLATVAALHGLTAPDPQTARVLEIGCGAGGNLLAMAAATPRITAVGIDLAAAPVEEGRRAVQEVGLTNVELRQGDVCDYRSGELGEFDYVIAHGLYAWVPPETRDAVLAACGSHLAADGLAYVSYNAHPGGHLRRVLREAGLWFARGETEAVARAEKAQVLYRYLLENRVNEEDWWGAVLARTVQPFAAGPTYRLVHDDLSDYWAPVWFADFARHAAAHGLGYVGDADLRNLLPERVPPDMEEGLWELAGGDRIAFEQHTDLLRCVFFRQTVLCRDSRTARASLDPEGARRLSFSVREGEEARPGGLLGDALDLLRARAPETLAFDELRVALAAEPRELAEALLEGFNLELVMPHGAPLRAVPADAERPIASALARWQARRGPDVTSLAYTNVRMEEPAARLLLTLLDGTRDRAAIRAEFAERTGVRLSAEDLDVNLNQMARMFLMSPSPS
jgi:SAM-dependent methyltransferase